MSVPLLPPIESNANGKSDIFTFCIVHSRKQSEFLCAGNQKNE